MWHQVPYKYLFILASARRLFLFLSARGIESLYFDKRLESVSKLDLPFPLDKETKTIHSTQLYTQVFHLISEHSEVICETREGVFHLISKYGEVIHQTQEGVFRLISRNPKSVFQKARSNILNTRKVFHLIYARHLEVIYQTREGMFHLLTKNPKSINPKSEKQYIKHQKSVSSDICMTPRSNISNTRRSVSSAN